MAFCVVLFVKKTVDNFGVFVNLIKDALTKMGVFVKIVCVKGALLAGVFVPYLYNWRKNTDTCTAICSEKGRARAVFAV